MEGISGPDTVGFVAPGRSTLKCPGCPMRDRPEACAAYALEFPIPLFCRYMDVNSSEYSPMNSVAIERLSLRAAAGPRRSGPADVAEFMTLSEESALCEHAGPWTSVPGRCCVRRCAIGGGMAIERYDGTYSDRWNCMNCLREGRGLSDVAQPPDLARSVAPQR